MPTYNVEVTLAAGIGGMLNLPYTAKTGDYTLLASESGQVFSNLGAAGAVDFDLPTAVVGLNYTIGAVSQTATVTPPAGVTISLGGTTGATGALITSQAANQTIDIVATSTTSCCSDKHIDHGYYQ